LGGFFAIKMGDTPDAPMVSKKLYTEFLVKRAELCSNSSRQLVYYPKNTYMKTYQRASKGFTLVEIMIVVVIIGLLAAMAIPAFQKVRQSSQDKAVLNNARQLAAAADQYYLENGVSSVTLSSLVGSTNYVKALNLVANETYPDGFTQGVTITVAGVAGQRTITYAP
jgi:type IV pilus assembly protein PilA